MGVLLLIAAWTVFVIVFAVWRFNNERKAVRALTDLAEASKREAR